jgi:hypothetical protein
MLRIVPRNQPGKFSLSLANAVIHDKHFSRLIFYEALLQHLSIVGLMYMLGVAFAHCTEDNPRFNGLGW